MNRSFQSIAALLVSLSGAMLAVTWVPRESPRPASHSLSTRKRAATVACGYLASGESMTAIKHRGSPAVAEGGKHRTPAASATAAPSGLSAVLERAQLPTESSAVGQLFALNSIRSAFGSSLAPLWPLRSGELDSDGPTLSDRMRQQAEAEYAAAELAAAAPVAANWIAPAWRRGVASLDRGIHAAARGEPWQWIYEGISGQITDTYELAIAQPGWQETVPPVLAHLRRLHDRLALREALLKEMDRRFLEVPLDREYPLPPKPYYRGPSRKLMLAAADALKSLSHSLSEAAARLEEASRQDVAELHTPSQNKEEKR